MVALCSRGSLAASAVISWKWVANKARQRFCACKCSIVAQAIDNPSKVAVPRPISSKMTSARSPAWLRMAAVSTISTMKVEWPRARSSAAPTRENSRSTTPICAARAGTKLPIWARMAISAFWRRKVDFPAIFGPVTIQIRPAFAAGGGDCEREAIVDLRADIIALDRERGERAGHVESRNGLGGVLDSSARGRNRGREAIEDFELQRQRAFGRSGDLRFQLAKFGGGEADLPGGGLAMNEGGVEWRGHQLFAVLRRNINEIAEHIVVPDFQRANAGGFGVAHLQARDHAPRFVAQRARPIERRCVAGADKAAVAPQMWQLVSEHLAQFLGERGVALAQLLCDFRDIARQVGQARESRREVRRGKDAVANGAEIARPAAADDDTRQCARQIRCAFEPRAQIAARRGIGGECRHRVEPMTDLDWIAQGRGEPLRQKPRPCRGDSAIGGAKERAAPLAGERATKFEIAAGSLVERECRAGGLAHRRSDRRALAELGTLHIGDYGCRGRQFDARECAEGGGGRHAEEAGEPAFRG